MTQVYIAVPVSEGLPEKDSNFIMIWEVEVMQDDWVFKAREGDLFHLEEYSKLSNVRNLKRLEPREGYFLEREELEVKKLVDDFFVIKENDPNPYRDLGDLGLAVAKIFGYLK